MNNIAIIGASYLQLPLIKKAKELGYTTHVFAWEVGDIGEKEADYFYPISITEIDAITEKCREIGIIGICSIATDLGAITVNKVADALGLPGNSIESTLLSSNKHFMRKAFESNGDPSPASFLVDDSTDFSSLSIKCPLIVKPTDRSGSRGINKVDDPSKIDEAVKSALMEGFEKKALIEEYVTGQEFSVEGISFQGKHHILAVTEKFTTGAPHFIEIGHREPANINSKMFEKIVTVVTHALDSLQITNSASHSEIKIDKAGNINIIEIGGRMGGDCIGSHLVYYSTGIDFLRAVIQVACGIEPDLTPVADSFPVEVRFLFTEDDVRKMEECKKTESFVEMISYYPQNIGKTTDSSNRAGCYIVRV